jgi:hypothetical protein
MGTWDRILAVLRREKRDVAEAVEEFTERANAGLDRRERELHATPEERLAMEQERAAENDAELEAIRRRIEGRGTADG